jgi:hypothetical protein
MRQKNKKYKYGKQNKKGITRKEKVSGGRKKLPLHLKSLFI